MSHPSGGTEPGSEGEWAEDSGQRPRRRRPPPFFYRWRFVRGPRPPNQQQPIEGTDGVEPKETAPLEGDQQGDERVPLPDSGLGTEGLSAPGHPSSLPQKVGMARPSPAKAPLMGPRLSLSAHETAPTSSGGGSSPPDPGSPQPWRSQPPSTVGTPPPPYWSDSNTKDPQSYHLVVCQFFQLPCTPPSSPPPFP
ncbi:hypothetical protein GH733_007321 [Mirounga leonina]|nr:hypothetical protein GH733_007321 [Mirounga leonina]